MHSTNIGMERAASSIAAITAQWHVGPRRGGDSTSDVACAEPSWARITTGEREIPPARVYHTAVAGAHTDYLVFGGSSVSAGFLSDLWQLNVTGPATGLWQRVLPKPGERPPPRAGHTAALWEGRMVVFGGRNSESVLNDVWVYDVEASEWSQAHAGGAACSAAGSCPSPRTNHAAVLLEGDLLLVNGGSSADGTDLNDSWLLHLPSSTWTPAPSIASPAPRHGHAMWSTASLEGAVLYGGQAGTLPSSPFWGDTWAWCASKAGSLRGGMGALGSWVKVQNASYAPHGGAPQPRAYVAAAGAAGRNLLFGGFSGYQGGLNDELHQDTWALNASFILKRACL
ncbi:tea1 [Symbiodinium sp. KB8]|nr:tea1 [Symbiodinium sp. KB8]